MAKGLNKFSISDILQIVPESENSINKILEDLEGNSVIKKVSATEYLYTKIREITSSITQNIFIDSNCKWLTIDEVCEITKEKRETVRRKCKNKTYISKYTKNGKYKEYLIRQDSISLKKSKRTTYTIDNINILPKDTTVPLENIRVFKNEKEQEYFNSLPPYAQKFVFRYITVFKLAGKLKGKALNQFLKKLAIEHPEYKVNYSSFKRNIYLYSKEGIKAIVPKYGTNHRRTCIPPDMYEKFKELYLAPNKYSIQGVVKMLKNYGFEEDLIPHYKSFERLLHKEYTPNYIETIKKTPIILPELQENICPETEKNEIIPTYSRYIDAAQAYLESIENSHLETDICRRGYILNHLNPYFKNFDINELTQDDLLEFQKIKITEGYTSASIKRFLSTLTVIMNTNHSDYKHLTFSHQNTILPPEEKGYLLSNEIEELKKASSAELWILALGINPAELLALNYEDIDYTTRVISINKALINNRIYKHRKKYKTRIIKMPKILFKNFNTKGSGRIFKDININNYNLLLNTHVKLLLDKNIPLNIISKNLGIQYLNEFEIRFKFLLPQKMDDNFEIL